MLQNHRGASVSIDTARPGDANNGRTILVHVDGTRDADTGKLNPEVDQGDQSWPSPRPHNFTFCDDSMSRLKHNNYSTRSSYIIVLVVVR